MCSSDLRVKPVVPAEAVLGQPDHGQRHQIDEDKHGLTPQGRLAGQDAEGSAVVGDIGQVEEAGHKLPAFKQDEVGAYPEFADLIQQQRGQKNRALGFISCWSRLTITNGGLMKMSWIWASACSAGCLLLLLLSIPVSIRNSPISCGCCPKI